MTAGFVMYLVPTIDMEPFASVGISLGWGVVSLLIYEFAAIASAFSLKNGIESLNK